MATKTLEELHELGYKIATRPKPAASVGNQLPTGDSACYKHWKANKHLGVPYGPEYDVSDSGGKAIVTSIGYVIHWDTHTTTAT